MKIYNILMGWEEFSGISIPSEIHPHANTRFLQEARKIMEAYKYKNKDLPMHAWPGLLID